MTSLSSQLDSLAFISKGSTDRKAILGKFLDLELFDAKYKIAKEEPVYDETGVARADFS